MRAFFGAIVGLILGSIAFMALHFEQLLLVGKREAGLLVIMQLNQSVDTYLFGGMILGAIIGLSTRKT